MHKEDFRVIKQKGFYKLINGDCLEVMKGIPDKSIDCVVCDQPYGTTACKWDSVIPFEPLWNQYKRIIKDNGAIVLFGSEPFSTELRHSNLSGYKYDWIWDKVSVSNQ
jgi:site-specific DNA-methyltransferase (adenine-specific)